MMGSTLLSVDAAELGDRALVDSLLHRSYQPHLKRALPHALGDTHATTRSTSSPARAGSSSRSSSAIPGSDSATSGLEEAFAPVLPSHVTRLSCGASRCEGRRIDVIVDKDGRRIEPRRSPPHGDAARAAAPAPGHSCPGSRLRATGEPHPAGAHHPRARARRHHGLPGVPHPFLSRLPRQCGADLPRRAVAAESYPAGPTPLDESVGFTARGVRGKPAKLDWGAVPAGASFAAGTRTIEYRLAAAPGTDARVVRARHHAGGARLPVRRAPPRGLHRAAVPGPRRSRCSWRASPPCRRPSSGSTSLCSTPGRSTTFARGCGPTVTAAGRRGPVEQRRSTAAIGSSSSCGADPRGGTLRIDGRTRGPSGRAARRPVCLRVRVTTDAPALTPLARDRIFTQEFLAWLARGPRRRRAAAARPRRRATGGSSGWSGASSCSAARRS